MDQNNRRNSFSVEPQSLPKMPTRIRGLDNVLHGGLPEGRLTIVNGGPGAGKTILGMELLLRSNEADRSAVFISFEETKEAMRRNALAMGWELSRMEEEGKLALINPNLDFESISSGSYSVEGLCAILEAQVKRIGADLIVIDAIDMLMRLFEDSSATRNQMVILHRWLDEQGLTAVLTVKSSESLNQQFDYLDFMADCVINIDQRVVDQVTTRRLVVKKYRGSDYASREHPFMISNDGLVVMPLSFVDLVQQPEWELLSTGNDSFNSILGGGFRRGSSILISGPSGSGKTTIAFTLTSAAAAREERTLYLSFEQSEDALIREMDSVGFDLQPLIDDEYLHLSSIMPESMGMEEHLYRIIRKLEELEPDHMVIDAISATHRIGSRQAAMEFLIRLYYAGKRRGITCIFTNQTFSIMQDEMEISGLGISSLVDTALILNYFREEDYFGRNMLVLKSRGTNHSNRYHQFHISDNGIAISGSGENG